MRLAKVEGGVVVNIISANAENYAAHFSDYINVTSLPAVQIGWLYNGSTFSAPSVTQVKNSYTLAQWIDVLTDSELDAILDYVNGETGTIAQKRAARRVWEYWRANNSIDFNIQKNRDVLTWLVNNSGGVWTNARKNELIG